MYLSPPVHYPSIIAPVFLIIVVLVPLIFCVRKTLTLYNHLNDMVRDDAENTQHG